MAVLINHITICGPTSCSHGLTWNDADVSRLSLGTAQWGSGYGITNVVGRMSDSMCLDLIETARACAVQSIDTALRYGDAQIRLRPWATEFEITTKVSSLDTTGEVHECFEQLGVQQIHTVLLRDWDELPSDRQAKAVHQLADFLDQGSIQAIGVSVYGEASIHSALNVFAELDTPLGVVQIPASAVDRRLDESLMIQELDDCGTRIQLRSVFLQGLLAESTANGHGRHPDVVAFHAHAEALGLTPIEAALAHAKSLPWVDEVIVGVTSSEELRAIAKAWDGVEPMRAPADLASEDLDLIDPRRW